MAGLGRKVFTAGEVLSAANVQGYLQDQTVMVFAGTAARGSAIGTAVSEGMVSYLADTNTLQFYDGADWQNVSAPGDITAVTAGTGLSGGGVSGDVTLNVDYSQVIPTNTVTTAGDLIIANGSASVTRLPIGANGRVLQSNGTSAAWVEPVSGFTITSIPGTKIVDAFTLNNSATVSGLTNGTYIVDCRNTNGALIETATQVASMAQSQFAFAQNVLDGSSPNWRQYHPLLSVTDGNMRFEVSPSTTDFATQSGVNLSRLGIVNNVWFAVNTSNHNIYTSSTGADESWTNVLVATANQRRVAFGGSTYVVWGNSSTYYTSTNGTSWTTRTFPAATTGSWQVIYGDGKFVLVGNNSSSGYNVQTSTDAISWTQRANATTPAVWATDIWFGHNGLTGASSKFVAVPAQLSTSPASGHMITSDDAITWTARTIPATYVNFMDWLNDRFVMTAGQASDNATPTPTGTVNTILTSTDGVTWTSNLVANTATTVAGESRTPIYGIAGGAVFNVLTTNSSTHGAWYFNGYWYFEYQWRNNLRLNSSGATSSFVDNFVLRTTNFTSFEIILGRNAATYFGRDNNQQARGSNIRSFINSNIFYWGAYATNTSLNSVNGNAANRVILTTAPTDLTTFPERT